MSQPSVRILSRHEAGDMVIVYLLDTEKELVGLQIYPLAKEGAVVPHRDHVEVRPELLHLPEVWRKLPAWTVDSLLQVKVAGDRYNGGFAGGRTLRGSVPFSALKYVAQTRKKNGGKTTICTEFRCGDAYACRHFLSWSDGAPFLESEAVLENIGQEPITLEMMASFSLGGISPFHADDAPGALVLHRFRSGWSAEGRLESVPLEDLGLERSWIGHAVRAERFGAVGSMPTNGFFPMMALEDRKAGVTWGAHLACASSWQMEVYRREDFVCLSGGLADREFGHWTKIVSSGESFRTPVAYLGTAVGGIDELSQRLVLAQEGAAKAVPEAERTLPLIFNEWCSSWGEPSHASMVALADRLKGTRIRYLVIDGGWYDHLGDWTASGARFPQGLKATADAIRERGLIPGIWFEMEACLKGSAAFDDPEGKLTRDGKVLWVGDRRFWDFRKPETVAWMTERVIDVLRECRFGYLKIDYNETIGLGCDGAESLGEGLRQHLAGVQEFFRKITGELPDLVIENCSSGGHRLEPSMMALCSMGSFSDAHETTDIPIIAANLHRLILPRQSQVWAVLRKTDTARRLAYSLAATFLGRMCISGDVLDMTGEQWALFEEAQALYRDVWPTIAQGYSHFFGPRQASYRHPEGWQAVLRVNDRQDRALIVLHTFAAPFPSEIEFPLPISGTWKIGRTFGEETSTVTLRQDRIHCQAMGDFSGVVLELAKTT